MPERPTDRACARDIQRLLTAAHVYSCIDSDCKFRVLLHLAKVHISKDDSAFLVDNLHVYPLGLLKYILRRLRAAFAEKTMKQEKKMNRDWESTFRVLWTNYPRELHSPTSNITADVFLKQVCAIILLSEVECTR